MCGLPYLSEKIENVVILCGDVPLLTPGTVMALVDSHEKGKNHITVLAVEVEDPTGYGRMVVEDNQSVAKIVEEADASAEEKDIKIINSGVYCVQKEFLQYSLGEIKADNKQEARLNCIAHLLSVIPYEEVPFEEPKLPKIKKKDEGTPDKPLFTNYVPEKYK